LGQLLGRFWGRRGLPPELRPAQQLLDRLLDGWEGRREHLWTTDHEDKIVAGGNCREGQTDGLAHAALCSVPPDRRTELLADDEPAAGAATSADYDVERKERRAVGATLAPGSPKLIGPAQPIGAFHGARPMILNRVQGTGPQMIAPLSLYPVAACLRQLTMAAATGVAALVADSELIAALQAAAAQHLAAVLGLHPGEETMLAPARDTLRLPCTLRHLYLLNSVGNASAFSGKLGPLYSSPRDRVK
jgi:hypothetical protein